MVASPPPYSPKDQRRAQKEYWRAQREALRSQRYYWRAMHRPSMVGPILLIVIGVVAFLLETGRLNSSNFWEWFLHWWPVLFIVVGAVSLLEWYLDRDRPYKTSRSTFGIVLLIGILIAIAYSRHHWSDFAGQFGDNEDWSSFMGQEHDHDAEQSVIIPANASVQIQNPHGDVTVTTAATNEASVTAHQVVHTDSSNEAEKLFTTLAPKVTVSGNTVLIRVEGSNKGRADLTVQLPQTASVDISAGHGDVTVDGLKGNANVDADHGDVKLTGIGSNVHTHMNKGDFSAHEIGANLALDGHVGDVTISEVKGGLALDGDFFGDTHLEQVGSAVHFHSSRTDLQVARLLGDLTMDSGDLHVGQSVGPLRIVTRSKDIDCSQVSGDVHIENANGEVTVTAAQPLGNIQISNESEPITLTLPKTADFTITANTYGGDLNTDFPLNVTGGDEHRSASGQVGKGGPKIDLTARHGDISIKKADVGPVTMPPEPPAPPTPQLPKAPPKHLNPPKVDVPSPKVL